MTATVSILLWGPEKHRNATHLPKDVHGVTVRGNTRLQVLQGSVSLS